DAGGIPRLLSLPRVPLLVISLAWSIVLASVLFMAPPQPPLSTLFPYTTLFRSSASRRMIASGSRSIARRASPAYRPPGRRERSRSEEHTSELQSRVDLVCRLLLEKKKGRAVGRGGHQPPSKPRGSAPARRAGDS